VGLQAGFPISVPDMQLDRRCGSGVQAVVTAAMMVQSGAADVVMASGRSRWDASARSRA